MGKTTLFRAITGEDEVTGGEVWRHPCLRFTLLRQNRGEQSAATVHEAALEPFAELIAMEERIGRELEQLGGATDPARRAADRARRRLRRVGEGRRGTGGRVDWSDTLWTGGGRMSFTISQDLLFTMRMLKQEMAMELAVIMYHRGSLPLSELPDLPRWTGIDSGIFS